MREPTLTEIKTTLAEATEDEKRAWVAFAQGAIVADQLLGAFQALNECQATIAAGGEPADHDKFFNSPDAEIVADLADELLWQYRQRFGK